MFVHADDLLSRDDGQGQVRGVVLGELGLDQGLAADEDDLVPEASRGAHGALDVGRRGAVAAHSVQHDAHSLLPDG